MNSLTKSVYITYWIKVRKFCLFNRERNLSNSQWRKTRSFWPLIRYIVGKFQHGWKKLCKDTNGVFIFPATYKQLVLSLHLDWSTRRRNVVLIYPKYSMYILSVSPWSTVVIFWSHFYTRCSLGANIQQLIFNSSTFLWRSQARTWIFNNICCGLYCFQWVQ